MNTKDIADAIAARFVGITANGQAIAVGPTASLPNTVAKGPALLVFHPSGSLELAPMRMRRDVYDYPVRLLVDPLNYPQRSDALYAWFDAMRDRVEMDMDLGLDYVLSAKAVSATIEMDDTEFYGGGFDVVELTVRVKLMEVVSSVSI